MHVILLVDDDGSLRSMLRRTLERAGYAVVEATNGRSALAALAHNTVDLVLTDVIMPDMEGIELILQLRKTRPELPVIAMSGGGVLPAGEYLQMALDMGAVSVLAKPFDSTAMLSAVAAIVG